jgi:hypothetical protein
MQLSNCIQFFSCHVRLVRVDFGGFLISFDNARGKALQQNERNNGSNQIAPVLLRRHCRGHTRLTLQFVTVIALIESGSVRA